MQPMPPVTTLPVSEPIELPSQESRVHDSRFTTYYLLLTPDNNYSARPLVHLELRWRTTLAHVDFDTGHTLRLNDRVDFLVDRLQPHHAGLDSNPIEVHG